MHIEFTLGWIQIKQPLMRQHKLGSGQLEVGPGQMKMLSLCREQYHQETSELNWKKGNDECHPHKVEIAKDPAQILEELLITQGANQKRHHL